jgi:hypothetical protein
VIDSEVADIASQVKLETPSILFKGEENGYLNWQTNLSSNTGQRW